MGGQLSINLTNLITVGLIAFIAVFAINKALAYANMPQWQA